MAIASRAFAMSVLSGSVVGSQAARAGTLLMNTQTRAAIDVDRAFMLSSRA
jgi:hypothetical protein